MVLRRRNGEILGESGCSCGCRHVVAGKCRWCGRSRPRREPSAPSGENMGVIYHIMRCPHCQGTDHRVTSTQRPVRYHKCNGCDRTFKSVEE